MASVLKDQCFTKVEGNLKFLYFIPLKIFSLNIPKEKIRTELSQSDNCLLCQSHPYQLQKVVMEASRYSSTDGLNFYCKVVVKQQTSTEIN